jgi:hypothetical protein
LKERAFKSGHICAQQQVIQQREHRKIEHATTLTYCQVITHTKSSIVFQTDTVLQLWCQSIQPIPTAGILYIRTVPNPTIQKVPKPPFVTKCTFETNFFPVAVGLLPEQSTNSGRLYSKIHFSRRTLWVANAASLVRSKVTHIEVYKYWLHIINIVFTKYYWGLVLPFLW